MKERQPTEKGFCLDKLKASGLKKSGAVPEIEISTKGRINVKHETISRGERGWVWVILTLAIKLGKTTMKGRVKNGG